MLLFFVILLAGCSSQTKNNNQNQPMQTGPGNFRGNRTQFNRSMNLTEEERQQMNEARIQLATAA